MTRNENRDYWDKIISEAYRSHEPIRRWCAGHSICAGVFYEWAKELGYTKDGKKTEKCLVLMKEQPVVTSAPTVPASPVFVEVPAQVLGGFSEMEESSLSERPLITIQAGDYQIRIPDGFNELTLSKVLEVIRYA